MRMFSWIAFLKKLGSWSLVGNPVFSHLTIAPSVPSVYVLGSGYSVTQMISF